ncbi:MULTISPECIES: cysteine hydrolase family protein [unclassified Streptomyces]|uniref:cysteine hydrolase family protein n=1 Tax=unclassified Streptomyces TaxID=2593676 RepID=UPI000BACB6CE|nr:isochorismatase family cysteine hydrolase [Streptomyces sp. CLI2509]ASY33375.1 isochorismatase [Streptomyces sp. CLI2509]MYX19291.1 isochorismatase family protein [Streptomyces sp. SID8380]
MSRTALLLMDFQNAHATRVDPTALTRAAAALAAAREKGVLVIHVALLLRAGHVDAHPNNKVFGALPHDRFVPGDPDAEIHPDVAPAPGEPVLYKNRVSAFAGTNLDQILRAQGVDQLALAGIATGGIVLSTALQAIDLDYRFTALSDACADPDPELHEVLLGKLLAKRGEVATVKEWAARL